MAKNNNVRDFAKDIADALRAKKNSTEKINPQNFSTEIANLTTGGYNINQVVEGDYCDLYIEDADDIVVKYECIAIDYDGTILKKEYLPAGAEFILPQFPNHDRLTAEEWSGTVEVVEGKAIVPNRDIIFGVVYTTKSGYTEFDIKLNVTTGLHVILNLSGEKDWGDGTTDSSTTHDYGDYGEYTIKWGGSNLNTGESYKNLFAEYSDEEDFKCVKAHIGSNVTSIGTSFYFNNSLIALTIPKSVVDVSTDAFYVLDNLRCIVFSSNLTSIAVNAMLLWVVVPHTCEKISVSSNTLKNLPLPDTLIEVECTSNNLEHINLPSSVKNLTINGDALLELNLPDGVDVLSVSCNNIKSLTIPASVSRIYSLMANNLDSLIIPDNVAGSIHTLDLQYIKYLKLSDNITTIGGGSRFLSNLYCLKEIKMPSKLEFIVKKCFTTACYSLEKIDFSSLAQIPSQKSSSFKISPFCKVVVPDEFYDTLYNDSSWGEIKNNLCKASEVV